MQNASTGNERLPRRLAFVITELEPGGAERCCVEVATRLDRSRFLPVVYSLGPRPVEAKQSLVARLAEANIPTDFLSLTSAWQYFSAVRMLAKLLHDQQPEIVQTFLFHANVVGTRAARAAGVKHVITGLRVADPRWWRAAIERRTTTTADRHICVSQSVAEYYRRRGFAAEKLVVIPNGIELARWRDAHRRCLSDLSVVAGRRLILFVGRLDQQKGLDRFFELLPSIFRELPGHDLLLVGDGPQRTLLERMTRHLKLQDRVYFAGWQSDVPSIMAAADLLILPSRWEGMPNVVLEAMAAGKPVVATQAEGTVELLGLAALEQTAPVGDWQQFRKRVIEIAKHQSASEDLGQRNQIRAEQFSLDAVVARYQRLYESILDAD